MEAEAARRLVEQITALPGFSRSTGVRIVSVEPGEIELALPRRDDLLQANGYFHGGVIAGLADHAAGAAVTTSLPQAGFAVTINMLTSYLAPASGQTLLARAKAEKVGKTVGVARVELFAVDGDSEQLCALATVTLRPVSAPHGVASRGAAGSPGA